MGEIQFQQPIFVIDVDSVLLQFNETVQEYFRKKYGVDIRDEFRGQFATLEADGWLTVNGESIDCTRDGLIQIDRHLPLFFDPQYQGPRYA